MKLRIIIAFMALVLAVLPALVAAPSAPVAAAPASQWGDMSLIGPYNVTLSGMSGAAGGQSGEIQTTIDNFQFDFPIVGMVHHRTASSGGNITNYKMGVYPSEPPIPALDGRWVPDTNGRRIYFDEWRCYSAGVSALGGFSQVAVCNEARSLLGLPSGWAVGTADTVKIDAGYPFSVVFSMGCVNSSSGSAPCSVTLQYWLIAAGASAGSGGGDGQPACPAGEFETDGLTIEWMSACYHCLPEIAPLPTTEPDPQLTRYKRRFLRHSCPRLSLSALRHLRPRQPLTLLRPLTSGIMSRVF